jgi:hypothetical protein
MKITGSCHRKSEKWFVGFLRRSLGLVQFSQSKHNSSDSCLRAPSLRPDSLRSPKTADCPPELGYGDSDRNLSCATIPLLIWSCGSLLPTRREVLSVDLIPSRRRVLGRCRHHALGNEGWRSPSAIRAASSPSVSRRETSGGARPGIGEEAKSSGRTVGAVMVVRCWAGSRTLGCHCRGGEAPPAGGRVSLLQPRHGETSCSPTSCMPWRGRSGHQGWSCGFSPYGFFSLCPIFFPCRCICSALVACLKILVVRGIEIYNSWVVKMPHVIASLLQWYGDAYQALESINYIILRYANSIPLICTASYPLLSLWRGFRATRIMISDSDTWPVCFAACALSRLHQWCDGSSDATGSFQCVALLYGHYIISFFMAIHNFDAELCVESRHTCSMHPFQTLPLGN